MPVGTKGTVKGLTPGELRSTGAGILLGNTYHLYLPPGARLLVATGQRMIGGETVIEELDPVKAEPRRVVEF